MVYGEFKTPLELLKDTLLGIEEVREHFTTIKTDPEGIWLGHDMDEETKQRIDNRIAHLNQREKEYKEAIDKLISSY